MKRHQRVWLYDPAKMEQKVVKSTITCDYAESLIRPPQAQGQEPLTVVLRPSSVPKVSTIQARLNW